MKKMIMHLSFLLCIGLLLCNLPAPSLSAENNDTFVFSFEFTTPEIENVQKYNQIYQRIILEDTKLYAKTGEPSLPVKPLRILLPIYSQLHSLRISSNNVRFLTQSISNIELGDLTFPLNEYPTSPQPPHPNYDQQSIYPQDLYHVIGTQHYRGFSILHLNLHPVQYHPYNNTISYVTNMTIEIDVSFSSTHKMYRGQAQDFDHINRNVDIINQEIVTSYQQNNKAPTSGQDTIDYVLITTEEFKNYDGPHSFHELIAARENQDITATIKTVEEIDQEYPGSDQPEKIRNFIKDAYMNWQTDWILLGGDVEFVPVRFLYDIDGADNGMASDIYYQCLDGDFNFDNDSWWGEKNDGVDGSLIDLYAEVYIGRASVDNVEQIQQFVRKTLAYESYEWGIDNHLEKVDSVGEYVWGGSGGWGAGYVERCIDYCDDYDQHTYGISSSQYDITERYERDRRYDKQDLINDIQKGLNIINHLGHSSPTYCMRFSPDDIFNFTNAYYGFWYSQGCHPGQFQAADECISEAWTVAPNGGFAAIMNTGYGYGSGDNYDGPDNRFAREFWDALNNSQEKISRIGKANQDSKEDNIWHIDDGKHMYHNYYSTTLFGDPYVQIKGMEDFRADFSWNPEFPIPGTEIQFHDESLGATSYQWNFGDGDTSTDQNPSHIYDHEERFEVSLSIQGSNGKTDTVTRMVDVLSNWPPFAVPIPKDISTDIPTISFQAENSWDPDGSITDYYWDFQDGQTSTEMAVTHTFETDGIYPVTLTVTDNEQKIGTAICDIRIDQYTPPETEVIIAGERGTNQWIIGPAYITLQSSDWSDIKRIKYAIDDEDWSPYENPVTIDEDGIHTIQFYAEDEWGNVEDVKSETFRIDSQPPQIDFEITGEKKQGWYTSTAEIIMNANDHTSDISHIYYKISPNEAEWSLYNQPILIDKDGRYTVYFYAEDNAGLTTDKDLFYAFSVDMNAPSTNIQIGGDPSSGGFLTLYLQSKDEGIGVKDILYKIDNGDYKKYIQPVTITGEGNHIISYSAIDHLDHTEEEKQTEVFIGESPKINILSPKNGIYISNNLVLTLKDRIIAIGPIDISISYEPSFLSLNQVSFLVDNVEKQTIDESPFRFSWNELGFGTYDITIKAEFIDIIKEENFTIIKLL